MTTQHVNQSSEVSKTSELFTTETGTPDNGDLSPLDLFFEQFDQLITRPADITLPPLAEQKRIV